MIRSPKHEIAEARTADFARESMQDRPGGVLVPFPAPGSRRVRRSPRAGESRGEILFFLGVRYERLAS